MEWPQWTDPDEDYCALLALLEYSGFLKMFRFIHHMILRRYHVVVCLMVGLFFVTFWNLKQDPVLRIRNKDGRLICSQTEDVTVRTCRDSKITRWSGLKFNVANLYFIQPDCQKYLDADLVMVIMSETQEFGLRMAIRETYVLPIRWKGLKVQHVFVVGLSTDKNPDKIHETILKESFKENDILQVKVREGLYSGSRAMIAVLQWLQSCACKARFVLKVGRNVLPNIFLIQKALKVLKADIHCVTQTAVVERHNHKQKYIRRDEYAFEEYPTFCESDTFVIKMEAAVQLLKTAAEKDIFKLEGPYITGLLRQRSCLSIESAWNDAESLHIRGQRMPLKIDWDGIFFLKLHDKHVSNFLTFWEDMFHKMTGESEKIVYINSLGG